MFSKARWRLLLRQSPFVLLTVAAIPLLSAAPAITSVTNAASNTPAVLPNASVAPGSIFVVKGSGMGPAALSITANPFQSTTLSGTSAAITVGGTTVNALMYYTSDQQIAALLPSNTPTGTGTITVTYNNQASPTAKFSVVSNNLGIFTVDSSGQGAGIITYADYSLVSPVKAANCGGPNTTCGAANSGDTLILWATGLGAITGSDASGAGLGVNMPNLPLKLWLGGVQATVIYQGRSGCCIGEDQIVFTVPDNVPTGCAVPLAVQITPNITQISNNVVMPIAAKGSRNCTPVDPSLGSAEALQQAAAAKNFKLGYADLNHISNAPDPGFRDTAHIGFAVATLNVASPLFAAAALDTPPLGTCIAKPTFGGDSPATPVSILDAGSTFTIKGPGGSSTVTANPFDRITLSATAGTFLVPGAYTITGAGGKDVSAFTISLNIPIAPTLTAPTSPAGLTVSRGSGMTVTWNGNGSTGHVELVLASPADANTTSSVVCIVPASAGTFTIPSYMLFTLANTNNALFAFSLGNQYASTSASFSAPGIDVGVADTFLSGFGTSFSGFNITN